MIIAHGAPDDGCAAGSAASARRRRGSQALASIDLLACTCIGICKRVCKCVYVYACVCIYIYICIYYGHFGSSHLDKLIKTQVQASSLQFTIRSSQISQRAELQLARATRVKEA